MEGVTTSGVPNAKPIHKSPPTRKRMDENGIVATEKLNPMPPRGKIKMVAPSGHVFELSLANGWAIKDPRTTRYYHETLEKKLRQGFIPYAECPVAMGRIPPKAGDTGCRDGQGLPKRFSDEECCPHVEGVIAARQEAQARKTQEFEQSFKSQETRKMEALEQMAQRFVEANSAASEPAEGSSKLDDAARKGRR